MGKYRKTYHESDILDILVSEFDLTLEEIAKSLEVKEVWADSLSVVGKDSDGYTSEITFDEMVQLLCRTIDGNK